MKKSFFLVIICSVLPFITQAQYELDYTSNSYRYLIGRIEAPYMNKYKDYYFYDSLALSLGITSSTNVIFKNHKGEDQLSRYIKKEYDELGRLTKSEMMGKTWNNIRSASYNTLGVVETRSNHSYSKREYNSKNEILSSYYESFNKNGKIYFARLTKYSYTTNGKLKTILTNQTKDTSILYPTVKYYYQNDTGSIIKRESFNKKGELTHTSVYDCNLTNFSSSKPKDSSVICNNIATDDRGFTYKTYINKTDKYEIKSVYTYDPQNVMVAYNKYSFYNNQQHLLSSYEKTKDSVIYKKYVYNKNFKKVKYFTTQKSTLNDSSKIIFTEKKEYFKNPKKTYTSIETYSYYSNGLLRQKMYETRNWKNKIHSKGRSVFHYNYY